jgi:type VI secretion system secreted protein Hcp
MSIYIKSSDIPGNVTAKGQENTFELMSVEYGVTRTIGSRVGKANADGGIAQFSEIVCTKNWDAATPKLSAAVFSGTALASMEIHYTRQDGDQSLQYILVKLEKVIVSSYSIASSGGEGSGVPVETFSLNYGSIAVTNTPPKPDGSLGTPSTNGFDLINNKKI